MNDSNWLVAMKEELVGNQEEQDLRACRIVNQEANLCEVGLQAETKAER